MSFSPASLQLKLSSLPSGARYWVAYSGGCDSHVLLHALTRLGDHFSASIRAVHVHHGLHPAADQWLAHCQVECERLGIELTAIRLALQLARGDSLEAVAREGRYRAMAELLAPGDILLTAQHQDDQAETLLLQLLRGSGPSGLAAMPEQAPLGKGLLVRPLLHFGRDELAAYARQEGLKWVEDDTNADYRFDRNYIRHKLAPVIARRWPAFSKTLSRSARHCAEAQQLIDQLAITDLARVQHEDQHTLSVSALNELPRPRCRAVLRQWLRQQGFRLPSARKLDCILDEVLGASADRSPLVGWSEAEIRRYRDRLFVLVPLPPHNPERILPWHEGSALSLPAGLGRLSAEQHRGGGIDPERWRQGVVEVRFRQGGERCRCQGEPMQRTLKYLFQELGLPPWLRDRVPLIYLDGELAVVGPYYYCEPFVASPDQTGIRIRWEGDAAITGMPEMGGITRRSG